MRYRFELKGKTPLLMHADDVMAADELKTWQKAPANKGVSIAGDDRSPPWTWTAYLYQDGTHLVMPQENIMAMLRKAAARIPMPKGRSSFMSVSQSGLLISGETCEFRSNGKLVPFAPILKARNASFAEQMEVVRKMGFELLVKRAVVGASKHVRVRAKFRSWSVSGEIDVTDSLITQEVLGEMFTIGGLYVGLCDWRPASPKSPGPFGTFTATLRTSQSEAA